MTDSIRLEPRRLKPSSIALPGSKSISNRTLLLAALSDNGCTIRSLLQSDDTDRMLDALTALGAGIEPLSDGLIRIRGCGGRFPQREADLFLGNAGTAFRPLAAALAVLGGNYRLHGVARMHERPIGDLVDALRVIGADIRYTGNENYPPLHIGKRQDNGIRSVPVKGNVSSQFLTALLMALPLTGEAFEIQVEGELISKPYIDITLKLMAQFGVQVAHDSHRLFRLPETARYHAPANLHVEGDASGASYFLAAGLLAATPVRVNGIGRHSIQGDTAFAAELEKIGAAVEWGKNYIQVARRPGQHIRTFDLDANHIPDAAMTLAVVALAVALGQVVNAGLLFTMLRLHEVYAPQFAWKRFLRRLAIALAVMAGGLWGVQAAFPVDWAALGGGMRALVLAGLMALAVVLYFGTLGLLGVRPREFRRREVA